MKAEFSSILSNLNAIAGDWAAWDSTYAFIEEHGNEYIERNLMDATFTNLKINFMLFINNSGQLGFGKSVDLIQGEAVPLPADLMSQINSKVLWAQHSSTDSSKTGFILINEIPVFIASRPILKSDDSGPIRGAFVIGKYLDSTELVRLEKHVNMSLDIQPFNKAQMPTDYQQAKQSFSEKVPIYVRPLDNESIAAYTIINDINGKPAFMLKMRSPRKIFHHGQTTIFYYIVSLLLIGVVFITLIIFLLEKNVLYPISRFSNRVSEISTTKDLSQRISVSSRDELGDLAMGINKMLDQVFKSTAGHEKTDKRLPYKIEERKKG
jgi:sensor domain CHASE-containing protein